MTTTQNLTELQIEIPEHVDLMDSTYLGANYLRDARYIVSIVPYWQANARNGVIVTYQNGRREFYDGRCEFVIEQLAKAFNTSIKMARSRATAIIGHGAKRKPPLALHKGFCLVSFKYRDLGEKKHDCTLCYVALQFIDKVVMQPNGDSLILFRAAVPPLPVMQQYRSVIQQIRMAQLMEAQVDFEQTYWDREYRIAEERLHRDPALWDEPVSVKPAKREDFYLPQLDARVKKKKPKNSKKAGK